MSERLSQDEVDALLRGVKEGEVAVGDDAVALGADPTRRPGVAPYDLFGEERLAARRFPALDLLHERLVRRLRLTFGTFLGTPPAVQLGRLEMLKLATFRNRLPVGATLHLFTMAPLRGQALLVVSAPLAFGLVDRLCGGAGHTPATLEAREYSAIEMQMIQRLVGAVLADLTHAWAPVHRIECRSVRCEINPACVVLGAPADMVLAVDLQCDFGSGPAPLVLAVPYAVLEPVRAKLGEPQAVAAVAGSDREWAGVLGAAVRQADVTVSAELGTREISTREVLKLRVGDMLPLGTRGDDPVALRVEGVRLMTGLAGVSRGQNAVRVLARNAGE